MSLRLKIVVAIALLIMMLGLGGTLHARLTLSGISRDELEKRALALARDLEGRAGEMILTNDTYGLYSRINDLATSDGDIQYVVVFDADGAVQASTFPQGLPVGLRGANSVPPGQAYSLKTLETTRGDVLDVAYPIRSGRGGLIRIGLGQERLEGQINDLTFRLLALTGAVLAAGLVVGYGLATFLTRPLARLAEAARAVGRGNLSSRVELSTRDETAEVAAAFNAMTEQLLEKEQERTQLLAKVIAAQEEERKRIARELHDEAGQALTSVLLGLKDLEDNADMPSQKARTAELRGLTASTLDLMRDMALELRPSTLDDLGLVAALQRYISDYGRKYGIEVDFHPGNLAGVRLRPQTETALYRIAQEALTNVARHAEARSVSILLDKRDARAILVVEDDGKGFDVDHLRRTGSPAQKLGLLGMEERAALVGGSLTIESRPGAGTAVFVEVPLDGDGRGPDPDPDR